MIIGIKRLQVACYCMLNVTRHFSFRNSQYKISTVSACDVIPGSESNRDCRLVKVAIIGPPNAGKSTLINNLVGRSICAMSNKVHTTRRRIKAITNEGNTQIIFLDTPGLVTADEVRRYKLEQSFIVDVEQALLQADIIGVVHDVSNHWTRDKLDPKTLRLLQLYPNKVSVLIINKIDTLKSKRKLLDLVKTLTNNSLATLKHQNKSEQKQLTELAVKDIVKQECAWPQFSEVFMISSLTGDGVDNVKAYLLQQAQPKLWIFKSSQFTDEPPEELLLQTIHGKLLEHLPQEIPYNLSLAMEYFSVAPEGTIIAVVLVKCTSPRIVKLIIGSRGERIKAIARDTEQDVQNIFRECIRLKLVVKSV